jgi:hypothetical protein
VEFPSGQRDQTVNLTRKLRWFESSLHHHDFQANLKTSSIELAFWVSRVWYNGRTSAFQADDASSILATRSILCADIAQLVERILGKDEVGSSNLPISTNIYILKNEGGSS